MPATVVTTVKPEVAPYVEAFAAARREEPDAVARLRRQAIGRVAEAGFPTRRVEAWRYNDLRALTETSYPPAPSISVDAASLAPWTLSGPSHRVVLVNGRFDPARSAIGVLPDGVWLGSTAKALVRFPNLVERALPPTVNHPAKSFATLNAALFVDGVTLVVPDGVTIDLPIEILSWSSSPTPAAAHVRNLILLGVGSRARVIETFAGTGAYWTNVVTAIDLAADADLSHVKLQAEAAQAIHIAANRVSIAARARYDGFVLTLGARLSRHDGEAEITGEHAYCGLNGAYLLRDRQEATNATFVDHAAPFGRTSEVFKGVVDGAAHGIFQGKIGVRQIAQKTDAHQLNKNLLLSPRAAVDTKPELEIYADDVKCSHGATVGDLDEAALFYLTARGIDPASARAMLIEAFATEAVEIVADETARTHLLGHLEHWLAARAAGLGGEGQQEAHP